MRACEPGVGWLRSIAVACLSVALAACGGGAGGNAGANPPAPPVPPAPPPPPANVVTASIGVDGGTLTSSDGRLTLTIPRNVLTATQTIRVETLVVSALSGTVRALGPQEAYRLSPSGLTFAQPVDVTLRIDRAPVLADGMVADFVSPFVSESNGVLEVVPSIGVSIEGDPRRVLLRARITHFSDLVRVKRLATTSSVLFDEGTEPLVAANVTYQRRLAVGAIARGTLRYNAGPRATIDEATSLFAAVHVIGGPLLVGLPTTGAAIGAPAAMGGNVELRVPGENLGATAGMVFFDYACTRTGRGTLAVELKFVERDPFEPAGAVPGVIRFASGDAPRLDEVTFATLLDVECLTEPPPTANADDYQTTQDGALTVPADRGVLANDSNADDIAGTLRAELLSGPANGMLALADDGSFTYTPNAGFTGTDTFTYRAIARDGAGASSAQASVGIAVGRRCDASFADDDTLVIVGNGVAQSAAFGTTAFNVTLADGQTLCIDLTRNLPVPPRGSPVFARYDFFGVQPTPPILLTLSQPLEGAPPSVFNDQQIAAPIPLLVQTNAAGTVSVVPPNVVRVDDSGSVDDYQVEVPDGNSRIDFVGTTRFAGVQIDGVRRAQLEMPVSLSLTAGGANRGTARASLTRIGSHTTDDIEFGVFDAGPVPLVTVGRDEVGILTYVCHRPGTYRVRLRVDLEYDFRLDPAEDGVDLEAFFEAEFDITCDASPPLPPTANADSYNANQDEALTVLVDQGVLANDVNPGGNAEDLRAVLGLGPVNGTLTLNADGSFTYTPANGFTGMDSFTYLVRDREGNASDPARVSIDVSRLCDSSVASDTVQVVPGAPGPINVAFVGLLFTTTIAADGRVCVERTETSGDDANVRFDFFGAARLTPITIRFDPALAFGNLPVPPVVVDSDTLQAPLPRVTADGVPLPVVVLLDNRTGVAPIEVEALANSEDVFLIVTSDLEQFGVTLGRIEGVRQARSEVPTELQIELAARSEDRVEARLTRVGDHTDADIEFAGLQPGEFVDVPFAGEGTARLPFSFICHRPGEYRVGVIVERTQMSSDRLFKTTLIAEFSITCLEDTQKPRLTLLSLNRPEGIILVDQDGFPIPNATPDSTPVIIAGEQTQSGPGQGAALAIDAATGSTLFAYDFQGTLFDALALSGSANDPDGERDLALAISGPNGIALKTILADGTGGSTQIEFNARLISDMSYLLLNPVVLRPNSVAVRGAAFKSLHTGTPVRSARESTPDFGGVAYAQPSAGSLVTPGRVRVVRHQQTPGLPGDFRFNFDRDLLASGGQIPVSPRTVVANDDGTRLVVVGGEGVRKELRLVRREFQPNGTVVDSHAVVGAVGTDPRRIRCALLPDADDYICALSDFTDNTVRLMTWDADTAPTLGPAIPVGQGPVGLDVFENQIVVAGFNDDSFTVIDFDPTDPLNADKITQSTTLLSTIPELAECDAVGHAVFLRDALRSIGFTCNLSNHFGVLPNAH